MHGPVEFVGLILQVSGTKRRYEEREVPVGVSRDERPPSRSGGWRTVRRVALNVGRWLLVVAAVPLGIVAAVAALLAVAAVTESRAVTVIAEALAVVLCTGGLSWLAVRGIFRSQRPAGWLAGAVTGVTLAAVVGITGVFVWWPGPSYTSVTATGETRYWELPTGSRVAYTYSVHSGTGEGKPAPVILVHGGPGIPAGEQERLTATLTRAGFDVYDYHQVGAGLSERLKVVSEYTIARHVADLEAIRAEIGAERVMLVGGSWGGKLIAYYLAAHPDHVARAVVYSPAPLWPPAFADTNGLTAGGLTAGGRQDQRAVAADHPRFLLAHALLQVAGPQATHSLLPDQRMDGIFQSFVGDLDMWAGCPAHRDVPQRASSVGWGDGWLAPGDGPPGAGFWVNAMTGRDYQHAADPRPALRRVSTPVLVLRGQCDYFAWEATRQYRDLLPGAVLIAIDDAGHTIPTDRPQLYPQAVRSFLLEEPLPRQPYTADHSPW